MKNIRKGFEFIGIHFREVNLKHLTVHNHLSLCCVISLTYWHVGKRIVEQERAGKERAKYGQALIEALADELTKEYGKSFSKRNLQYFRKFYLAFPDEQIVNACVHNLNWTHFRALYYYRLMQSPKKDAVMNEMLQKIAENQRNKFELLKSPIVAEFLGFKNEDSYIESDLKSEILTHIRDFLMEMGKGFAFVARQQHIVTETEDYFIDLVFYNIELKCYVLIDLKMGKITHQDVGQIDMYVRMYDELKCKEGDNPTLGILLCAETDEDIARYSVLHDNDRLFMSKYLTYLSTKEQLKAEIERQKEIFYMEHPALSENDKEGMQE